MGTQSELQILLVDLLGSSDVYFQPPPTVQMEYPCIVYRRDRINTDHADNEPYKLKTRYQITVIEKHPDGDIYKKVARLPTASYDRSYTADNLNHDVFTLFF